MNDLECRVRSTFKEAAKNPFLGFREILQDLNYSNLFKGSKLRKAGLTDLTILGSFGISSMPHELIHAGSNLLLGGTNKHIVMNKFYGGDLINYFYSGIESEWMFPLIGGYVEVDNSSALYNLGIMMAPYAMTPLGIYLLSKGKKKKSLALAIAGAGTVASHAGGIIGDFFSFGKRIVYETANTISNTISNNNIEPENLLVGVPMVVGGFYIGAVTMSFTYKMFKSGINCIIKE